MENSKTYFYPFIVKEVYLDLFGHMNNTVYMTLYEEARWDYITKNGYGVEMIKKSGLGPVLLDATIRFQKELRLRDEVVIETSLASYDKKIGRIFQKMVRNNEVCSTAEFTIALFDLAERKIVMPTPEWLNAL